MDPWAYDVLEFNEIRERLKGYASSSLGEKRLDHMEPFSSVEKVQEVLQQTEEAMRLLARREVSLAGIHPLKYFIEQASVGSLLDEKECLQVASTVSVGRKMKKFFDHLEKEEVLLPQLLSLVKQLEETPNLEDEILRCIHPEGTLKDQASPALYQIRRRREQVKQAIHDRLNHFFKNPHYVKMIQEAIATHRFNRYVIPIKQEYRSHFRGIVHDQSASGATVFMEPEGVIEYNNELEALKYKEERERESILRQLSDHVVLEKEPLIQNEQILSELDFIFARARWGQDVKGICPFLSTDRTIDLRQARHPAIASHQVVPMDIHLTSPHQAMVITGPNAGGKTVVLKIVGLFVLMTQCGIPIPVEEGSCVPVFTGVFADIGDEQSIVQNLSTFSGHLTRIIRILGQVDQKSLILLDELGSGTDPDEGAALATAILEYVLDKGSMVITTSHYRELKYFAYRDERIQNASVEFDVQTLLPTHRLLMGIPGSSHAFAISRRLGLPSSIIDRANAALDRDEHRVEEMIASLIRERKQAEEERVAAQERRKEAEKVYQEHQVQVRRWEEKKHRIEEQFIKDLQQQVSQAEKEVDRLLKELREKIDVGHVVKEHHFTEVKRHLKEQMPTKKQKKRETPQVSSKPITIGDEVWLHHLSQMGTVLEILDEHMLYVQVGMLKMKVHRQDVEKRGVKKKEKKKDIGQGRTYTSYTGSQSAPLEISVRGKRVDEALYEVESYIDQAILSGYTQVTIIHGKGTGTLRQKVQEFLRNHRGVKSFRLGDITEGGMGVTVVDL